MLGLIRWLSCGRIGDRPDPHGLRPRLERIGKPLTNSSLGDGAKVCDWRDAVKRARQASVPCVQCSDTSADAHSQDQTEITITLDASQSRHPTHFAPPSSPCSPSTNRDVRCSSVYSMISDAPSYTTARTSTQYVGPRPRDSVASTRSDCSDALGDALETLQMGNMKTLQDLPPYRGSEQTLLDWSRIAALLEQL